MAELVVLGGIAVTRSVIEVEETEVVNQAVEFGFMFLTIPVWFLTVVMNMSVIMLLWRNMTIVNKYMILDCLVSIMYSSLSSFQQSPYYVGLNLEVYCIPHMVLLSFCMQSNRLLPVIIALYRLVNMIGSSILQNPDKSNTLIP